VFAFEKGVICVREGRVCVGKGRALEKGAVWREKKACLR